MTYRIIEIIQGSLYLFLLSMVTYYAGVLVWKERDAGMDDIHDALPHRDWPTYASKLVALLGAIFLIVCLAMAERHPHAGVRRLSPLPIRLVGH